MKLGLDTSLSTTPLSLLMHAPVLKLTLHYPFVIIEWPMMYKAFIKHYFEHTNWGKTSRVTCYLQSLPPHMEIGLNFLHSSFFQKIFLLVLCYGCVCSIFHSNFSKRHGSNNYHPFLGLADLQPKTFLWGLSLEVSWQAHLWYHVF